MNTSTTPTAGGQTGTLGAGTLPLGRAITSKVPRFQRRRRLVYGLSDTERQTVEPLESEDERDNFERDRSRIVHSAAFRRLQGKTQVITAGQGDFFRTRLTHSLEVAQVAKGLALRLGASTALVEAIALAHDIGHPPFGHAGELQLAKLMRGYGGFEANAQNLRVVTRLERKSSKYDGLNLSRATLDGLAKYKQPFSAGQRKFYYGDDEDLIAWITDGSFPTLENQSFECQIMDWADDIAYAVHDLEDGIHAGFVNALNFNDPDVAQSITNEVYDRMAKAYGSASLSLSEVGEVWAGLQHEMQQRDSALLLAQPLSLPPSARKSQRKELTSFLIHRLLRATDRGTVPGAPKGCSVRYSHRVVVEKRACAEAWLLTAFVYRVVMQSPPVVTLEAKGQGIIRALFLGHLRNDKEGQWLPDDWRERMSQTSGSQEERARTLSDYVSGMTDEYAQNLYGRLFLPFEGTVFEKL